MKISDNVECRNWDPTDPNINNPWNNQKIEEVICPDEYNLKIKEIIAFLFHLGKITQLQSHVL